MASLLGPDGKPISSAQFQNTKAAPPKMGEAFGNWAGRDIQFSQLPGGGLIQFDLSKLTLEDFRTMRDHYQINASLAVLSFMQHQSDWHLEGEDQKINDACEEDLRSIWTPLNRSMATANWAGFSPNVLNWENDIDNRTVRLDKVKDLIPEECTVNWKEVEGWAPPGRTPPKFKIYDGIKQFGSGWPIPVDNSFWYPMLMENGDYYGRKLLRPAFTSWFFSILIHLFANRYYERFGEPTPIGRAPWDEDITMPDGTTMNSSDYMMQVLQNLRSRATVTLPSDRTPVGDGSRNEFDYTLEYLESQMRGADFERYMTRLDEEMSLALFTPILLLRTADVGSYNLGVGHMQMYLWMLNAMNDDRKIHIDKYILRKMTNFKFSVKAPAPKIVFRKLGNATSELLKEILTALISAGKVKPDIKELGQMAGMTLSEIKETTKPDTKPGEGGAQGGGGAGPGKESGGDTGSGNQTFTEVRATLAEIVSRVQPQVQKAFAQGTFRSGLQIDMGYKRKFEKALEFHGVQNAVTKANEFYGRMDNWLEDIVTLGEKEFSGTESFMALFKRVATHEVERIEKSG